MLQRDQFFVQELQEIVLRTKKSSPYTKYDLFEFLNDSVSFNFINTSLLKKIKIKGSTSI